MFGTCISSCFSQRTYRSTHSLIRDFDEPVGMPRSSAWTSHKITSLSPVDYFIQRELHFARLIDLLCQLLKCRFRCLSVQWLLFSFSKYFRKVFWNEPA